MLTSLADLLYWLLATLVVFAGLLFGNWGEVRLYVFLGLSAGVLLYYRLFSRQAIRLLVGAIRVVARTLRFLKLAVACCIIKPARYLLRLAARPAVHAARWLAARRRPPDENIPPQ
jgi:spore cortex biosynthesis protein YabQ